MSLFNKTSKTNLDSGLYILSSVAKFTYNIFDCLKPFLTALRIVNLERHLQ